MGERIRRLRIELGLSQAELARRIGIAPPSLSLIESGDTRTLKASTMTGLCRHLNTTPAYIVGSSGQSHSDGNDVGGIDRMEAELTAILRDLPPEKRVALVQYARFLQSPMAPKEASIIKVEKPKLVPKRRRR